MPSRKQVQQQHSACRIFCTSLAMQMGIAQQDHGSYRRQELGSAHHRSTARDRELHITKNTFHLRNETVIFLKQEWFQEKRPLKRSRVRSNKVNFDIRLEY